MSINNDEQAYLTFSSSRQHLGPSSATGSVSFSSGYHLEYRDFEKYRIGIILDSDGKFVAISEVSEKRDFLSPTQRVSKASTIEVDNYYRE